MAWAPLPHPGTRSVCVGCPRPAGTRLICDQNALRWVIRKGSHFPGTRREETRHSLLRPPVSPGAPSAGAGGPFSVRSLPPPHAATVTHTHSHMHPSVTRHAHPLAQWSASLSHILFQETTCRSTRKVQLFLSCFIPNMCLEHSLCETHSVRHEVPRQMRQALSTRSPP